MDFDVGGHKSIRRDDHLGATEQPLRDDSHMKPSPHDDSVCTALLVLSHGTIYGGYGCGATGMVTGEMCFNTSMTGYQEIITDPSYAGQIINFTAPHIGNVGVNEEDHEARHPQARGVVMANRPTAPSNYRSVSSLHDWLVRHEIVGIYGVDTRAITQDIRERGAVGALLCHDERGQFDKDALLQRARDVSSLKGEDWASRVARAEARVWQDGGVWHHGSGYEPHHTKGRFRVVAIDYGIKEALLRQLSAIGASITVVPPCASAQEILAHEPHGVFLSNGPGDPHATSRTSNGVIRELMAAGVPLFGVCLGHQLLALALGAKTEKMTLGHRGGNHPVRDERSGRVEITAQNHGFVVVEDSLPTGVTVTHRSLFDGTVEGIEIRGKPFFSVQHHPEASPGPHDAAHLFEEFASCMAAHHRL